METLIVFVGGFSALQSALIQDWIGPIFLTVIAAFSINFIIKRQVRELAAFAAIGAIAAVMIYGTGTIFGENGLLTNIAEGFANLIGGSGSSGAGGGAGNSPTNVINILKIFLQ